MSGGSHTSRHLVKGVVEARQRNPPVTATMEDALQAYELVTSKLSGLTTTQLEQVGVQLKLVPKEGDNRLRLLRRITNHLSSDEVQETPDEGLGLLQEIAEFLQSIDASSATQAEAPPTAPTAEEPVPTQADTTGPVATSPTPSATVKSDAKVVQMLAREFKISGQIGDPGQKDRLTFVSLANQLEAGLEKGYSDRDIIRAVIRAIVPGSPLRSYLEGRSKLTLPSLRRIVRAHFQEKEATELYKQLSQLTQEPKESPQAFLLRALDLRQKVIFASQEADSPLCYEPQLVQQMFRHSVLTGLRSDAIKMELRPHLDDPQLTDEVLFEKLNVFSSLEAERRKKLSATKLAAVNEIQEVELDKKSAPKQGLVLAEIHHLKNGIAELSCLKDQVAALQASLNDNPRRTPSGAQPKARVRRGCKECQQNGKGESCDHCFRCGSAEHYARGCRQAKSGQQGNDGRLRPGDRV